MGKTNLIPAFAPEAKLKRHLRAHLAELGFLRGEHGELLPPGEEKSVYRAMHSHHRESHLRVCSEFIRDNTSSFLKVIANGSEIDPSRIQLSLRKVDAQEPESKLFRMAALTWSVPVSNGFGRRLRYLVWDTYHDRLVGLIALGDPVFNLTVRDRLIGWNAEERAERLTNILDAYVLGALPPYSMLLGGKLIASLVRTREIYDDFQKKYGRATGIISGKNKRPRLLLVTTSSSLGRSSIYNRLKLGGIQYFEPIGYTAGWGHFHISDQLFSALRDYLSSENHPYVHQNRFGQGPNWRLRTIREAFKSLGVSEATLHHGIKREVYVCRLASNAIAILKSGKGPPQVSSLCSVSDVTAAAIERWILPRAASRPDYRTWQRDSIVASLVVQGSIAQVSARS